MGIWCQSKVIGPHLRCFATILRMALPVTLEHVPCTGCLGQGGMNRCFAKNIRFVSTRPLCTTVHKTRNRGVCGASFVIPALTCPARQPILNLSRTVKHLRTVHVQLFPCPRKQEALWNCSTHGTTRPAVWAALIQGWNVFCSSNDAGVTFQGRGSSLARL
jgi:hypothetical protein